MVLDTSVVRRIGAREVRSECFERVVDRGVTIHVADTAASEIINALVHGEMLWDHWSEARAILREVVDPHEPIMLGGAQGLARAQLHDPRPTFHPDEAEALVAYAAAWDIMTSASSRAELLTVTSTHAGAVFGFGEEAIRGAMRSVKKNYVAQFARFREVVLKADPNFHLQTPSKHSRREQIDSLLHVLAEAVDRNAAGSPKPSVRLDAFLRVHAMLQLRYLRRKDPYNPVKNVNDSLDQYLLRYLAIPALVCTCDAGLLTDVDNAGSWQRPWILEPSDLCVPERLAAALAVTWPSAA